MLTDVETEECSYCGNANDNDCKCDDCSECSDSCHCDICEGCRNWCSCCTNCEETEYRCKCCPSCGNSPTYYDHLCENCDCGDCCCGCEESSSFGFSDTPPWEKRGKKVPFSYGNGDWNTTWPEIDTSIDPCQSAAEFYILEAMESGALCPVPADRLAVKTANTVTDERLFEIASVLETDFDTLTKIRNRSLEKNFEITAESEFVSMKQQASEMLDALTEKLDKTLRAYFHMACAGEVRHHQAIGGKVLSVDRSEAWSGWREVYDTIGPDSLLDVAELFDEFDDGSGYGGSLWAAATRILHQRETGQLGPNEKMNKRIFIDRAWTLEHNGGCFLNKIGWAETNPAHWNIYQIKARILDAHAANPPNWKPMLRVCEPRVAEMFHKYIEVGNTIRVKNGMEAVPGVSISNEMRYLCEYCNSDPTKGHYKTCFWAKTKAGLGNSHKNYTVDTSITQTIYMGWYTIVHEDDWCNYSWKEWQKGNDNPNLYAYDTYYYKVGGGRTPYIKGWQCQEDRPTKIVKTVLVKAT